MESYIKLLNKYKFSQIEFSFQDISKIMMGIIEPSVPPIPFCIAAMVCSVVSEAANPNPSETTRKAINGCNFMTEMRVTKTSIAALMRSQMLIEF